MMRKAKKKEGQVFSKKREREKCSPCSPKISKFQKERYVSSRSKVELGFHYSHHISTHMHILI